MNKGFTLLEVIVATAIFSIVVSAISALFMGAVQTQRNVLAQQDLIDNTRYALEHMSRQIRMARRDGTGACVGTVDHTFTPTPAEEILDSLTFIDYRGDCLTYSKTGGRIQLTIKKYDAQSSNFLSGTPVDLTSGDIIVNALEFDARGEWAYDVQQPRVIIFLDAQAAGVKPESSPQILLQTVVSTRNIDTP